MQLVPVPDAVVGDYPFDHRARRPGGPEGILFARADRGPSGASSGSSTPPAAASPPPSAPPRPATGPTTSGGAPTPRASPPRAWSRSSPTSTTWPAPSDWGAPPGDLCHRTLARLFPEAPTDGDPGHTRLWVNGRGELPGRPRLTEWRWYGEPR